MIQIGQVFETRRTFSQHDIDRFAALSGDDNPIHVDPKFAADTRFGATVCHGMLLYSVLSAAIHAHIPGARQLAHEMMFPTGTPADEELVVRIEVVEMEAEQAVLEVALLRPGGEAGLRGRTRIQRPQARP